MRLKALISLSVMICASATAFAAENIKDMFADGSLRGEVRILSFERDFDKNTPDRKDTAAGGLLYYHTAPFKGISFGAAFATVNGVFNDDKDAVYSILARDEEGNHRNVTRLQEYFIQGEWIDTVIKYGAQEVRTPMLETHDLRMLPRTYKGLSIVNNSFENLTLSAYYLTDAMGWTDEEFISLSKSVADEPGGAAAISEDSHMSIFGVSYNIPTEIVKANVQGWFYTMENVYRETFFKASLSKKLGQTNVYFNPSYFSQKSQGDELNGEADTDQYGFNTGVMFKGFNVTGFYGKTGDDGLVLPWGDEKVVIQQVLAAGRAEEEVYAARVAYDFSQIGLKGLSAYIFHAEYDVPESTGKDQSETDYSVQYAFSGTLDGLSLRARYADIDVKDGGEGYNDIRFYAVYKFALGKKEK
ncbi:outer membrane porin, OprD family [Geovibrio thiophilus]|uniref:Outer membrane porin, OprD family n=1 Tax=Geovibrio thiophilus TaxID=139438 RepID=A0A3R5V0M0_9BACT|nr:OprD family outer membrane porin [Geovibrio thiophilus]QAR32667.1 outer membrane porin, OprD family [Geovibrio thiophilus]